MGYFALPATDDVGGYLIAALANLELFRDKGGPDYEYLLDFVENNINMAIRESDGGSN